MLGQNTCSIGSCKSMLENESKYHCLCPNREWFFPQSTSSVIYAIPLFFFLVVYMHGYYVFIGWFTVCLLLCSKHHTEFFNVVVFVAFKIYIVFLHCLFYFIQRLCSCSGRLHARTHKIEH